MKYKIGDKVKVRGDLEKGTKYYNQKLEREDTGDTAVEEMLEFAGQTVTISKICNDKYRLAEDECHWGWTDEMFEDDDEKYNADFKTYYESGRIVGKSEGYGEGYENGLCDAWECARKVAMYDVNIYEVFGTATFKRVWDMNPSEAIAKLKAYEAKQNEIKVGDIVSYDKSDGIVTAIKENRMYVMWKDGSAGEWVDAEKWFKKTGRHYDIDSIFEQLKGTDDEHDK